MHSREASESLQALLSDMWALKNENKLLYGDLCAAAQHAADVAAISAALKSGQASAPAQVPDFPQKFELGILSSYWSFLTAGAGRLRGRQRSNLHWP